jgi:hypothetical protein
MIPIVVAMLRFIGIEDLWESNLSTAPPLGGAPILLTVEFIQDMVTGEEFLFATWVSRILPTSSGGPAIAAGYGINLKAMRIVR